MDEKPTRVRLDDVTGKWAKAHPDHVFTARQCKDCGLFYKPSLGHRCEKETDSRLSKETDFRLT